MGELFHTNMLLDVSRQISHRHKRKKFQLSLAASQRLSPLIAPQIDYHSRIETRPSLNSTVQTLQIRFWWATFRRRRGCCSSWTVTFSRCYLLIEEGFRRRSAIFEDRKRRPLSTRKQRADYGGDIYPVRVPHSYRAGFARGEHCSANLLFRSKSVKPAPRSWKRQFRKTMKIR